MKDQELQQLLEGCCLNLFGVKTAPSPPFDLFWLPKDLVDVFFPFHKESFVVTLALLHISTA